MSRQAGHSGWAAAELAAGVALLLLPATVLVGALPTWAEHQALARVAAQEAARTVVLAGDWQAGTAAAHRMVQQIAANYGVPKEDVHLALEGALERGGAVAATVTVRVPALPVPPLTTAASFELTSRHVERVDDYRSFPQGVSPR